ncbi:MAG: hypothetical protein H7837_14250 [Magnetococcus sp. MYC-9]
MSHLPQPMGMNRIAQRSGRCLAILLCLVAGLHGRPACAGRVDLQPLNNTLLVDVLTTADLMVEEELADTLLRVYRLREDPPTCSDPPCPRERLFVSLATQRDDPKQAVFILPYAFGWQNPQFAEVRSDRPSGPTPASPPFVFLDVERVVHGGKSEKMRIFFNMQEAWTGR